jgi:hypothetical protein
MAKIIVTLAKYVMEQHVFAFSLIMEGATEKMLQFTTPLKSLYIKNLGFIELKCIFEQYREV